MVTGQTLTYSTLILGKINAKMDQSHYLHLHTSKSYKPITQVDVNLFKSEQFKEGDYYMLGF